MAAELNKALDNLARKEIAIRKLGYKFQKQDDNYYYYSKEPNQYCYFTTIVAIKKAKIDDYGNDAEFFVVGITSQFPICTDSELEAMKRFLIKANAEVKIANSPEEEISEYEPQD